MSRGQVDDCAAAVRVPKREQAAGARSDRGDASDSPELQEADELVVVIHVEEAERTIGNDDLEPVDAGVCRSAPLRRAGREARCDRLRAEVEGQRLTLLAAA